MRLPGSSSVYCRIYRDCDRLKREIEICNKLIEEGQKLIEKGKGKVKLLQNEIIKLTELITQLKFRISIFEGWVEE